MPKFLYKALVIFLVVPICFVSNTPLNTSWQLIVIVVVPLLHQFAHNIIPQFVVLTFDSCVHYNLNLPLKFSIRPNYD